MVSERYGVSLEKCVVCEWEEGGFGMVDSIRLEIRMDEVSFPYW